MATNGNYFGLYIDGQRIALTKSNDASFKRNFDDITSKDSNGNKESLPTSKEASGSMEGIFTSTLINKLQFSEDFNNSVWNKGGATVSGTKIEAVNGQKLGQTITWNSSTLIQQLSTFDFIPYIGQTITFSIYVKGTGSIQVEVGDDDNSTTSSTITLTSDWQRVQVSYVLITGGGVFVYINKISGTAFSVCYPQLEIGSNATGYKGSQEMFKDLITIQNNSQKVTFIQTTNIDGDIAMQYDGYISDLALKTTHDTAVTFTCNFTSTDSISITTI